MTKFADLAKDKNATEFQTELESVIGTKVNDAIVAKKSEVAGRLFTAEGVRVGARGARPRGMDSAQHTKMDTMHQDEFFKQRGAAKYETETSGKGAHKNTKTHGYDDKGQHVGTWDHKNAMGSYRPVAEETIDELKKSTMASYVVKAANEIGMSMHTAGGMSIPQSANQKAATRLINKSVKRLNGIRKATNKLAK